jgi:LDH2 family malate/lactate/ureidoglycolate dehydrogenase
MAYIKIEDLKAFCRGALVQEGMKKEYADIVAEVLAETDAYGTHSHGTKNLHNYIKKFRAGGIDIKGEPQIVADGVSFAVIDAKKTLGMIPSVQAMELACDKAEKTGIALVTVKNSCHFGAAGYYANIAAKRGFIGLAFSNVDPNMTAPGAKGMLLGNNPFSYAAPAVKTESVFLDIAMSNVASLKVVQARKDGKQIPDTWIVDKDGLPTTDPSHYPEEGAMQPMAAHKGYGLAVMVDLLTGILSGGSTSMSGDIVSWCFQMEKPNNVSHTFIAINPKLFAGEVAERVEDMAETLRSAPKAKGVERIYTPGEIEWGKHTAAAKNGINLPADVENSLKGLAEELGKALPTFA